MNLGRNRTATRTNPDSQHHDGETIHDAVLTWNTPRSEDGERGQGSTFDGLSEDVTAWATPASQDGGNATLPPSQSARDTLPGNVAGWTPGPTPSPSEGQTGPSDSSPPKLRRKGLNPRFGLWLMGYPVAWLDSVASVTRSSRKAPPRGRSGA
ncbi:MAG: hypothetical protein ACK52I_05565 [Pseudomonadota bacterium]